MTRISDPEYMQPTEEQDRLWILFASPTIWAIHLLACYITAAIWCAKFGETDSAFTTVRIAFAVYTVLALAAIGWLGWTGYQQHRRVTDKTPHDDDTPLDRHRFLGFATLLLSGLSAIATIYVALVAVFIGSCD
ncbi:hypothetical protein [Rubinisphaera margarita]|uniref:hypothetical protein n=1 Tax=Rubinisphaera margarita TaxID=2909586 RepID=UPI001EE97040|nr:hypothetical protein [Rubinisphaera margarita]MCG6154611.1 hypothetical protein [Rubinisphaera margarita]